MSIRRTSIATYEKIQHLLPPKRLACYRALYRLGQATASEIAEEAGAAAGKCPWKRVGELVEQGVVSEIGERQCSITGETVLVYQTTDSLPRELLPKTNGIHLTKTQRQEAFVELRRLVRFYVSMTKKPCPEVIERLEKWLGR